MKRVYLDNAATTKIMPSVLEKMIESYENIYGNPSAIYNEGQKAKTELEKVRNNIANYLGVEAKEIIFTSGATEANNLIIRGAMEAYPYKGKHIITSKIEHSAVLNTCKDLESKGYEVTYLDVDKNGIVDLEQLKNSIRKDTVIVSIMYVNNITGVIQPIDEIAKILDGKAILFHTDAVQIFGKKIILPKKQGISAMSFSAHKFYAPKGVGFIYLDKNFLIKEQITGASQERKLRAGTENMGSIIAMGKAVEELYENIHTINAKSIEIQKYLLDRLLNEIEDVQINGEKAERVRSIISVCIKGCSVQTLVVSLDLRGISISGGSACMSGSLGVSPVLQAMGLNEEELKGSFRISTSIYTTKDEIDYFIDNLKEIVEIERS